jgi:alpha-beta hydrolase superfamily lysophospholipase
MDTHLIRFLAADKLELKGLWCGPRRPRRVFIYIHGLAGEALSGLPLAEKLIDSRTAVFSFANRGSGTVNSFRQHCGHSQVYKIAGMAHEVFTECVADIAGAVKVAQTMKVPEIFLLGHSTGCQKSVYYLAQKPKSPVTGAVLLAPISDYASVVTGPEQKIYRRALNFARKEVRAGRTQTMLPSEIWEQPMDAQRFLSLYDVPNTGTGTEAK